MSSAGKGTQPGPDAPVNQDRNELCHPRGGHFAVNFDHNAPQLGIGNAAGKLIGEALRNLVHLIREGKCRHHAQTFAPPQH
jgi:hypothetical protein